MTYVVMMVLAFAQNVTFSVVSRARGRDNRAYSIAASVLSNFTWFMTFKYLVTSGITWDFFPFYLAGTTAGSEYGRTIAIAIEKSIGARADSHV